MTNLSRKEFLDGLIPASIADRVTCQPLHHLDGYLRDHWGKPQIRLVVEYIGDGWGFRYALLVDRDGPDARKDCFAFFTFRSCVLAEQVRHDPLTVKSLSAYDYGIIGTFGSEEDRKFVESERLFRRVALNDENGWNDNPPTSPAEKPSKDAYSPRGNVSRW